MLEEGTRITMANGQSMNISEIKRGVSVLCSDGSITTVEHISKDVQTTYQILQKTKHRANEGEAGKVDPLRKTVYHRLGFRCTLAHELGLRTASKPILENSFKRNTYKVKWKNLEEMLTFDGRIICIPKTHHKDFSMSFEGRLQATRFMEEKEKEYGVFLEFKIQVRDLDLLEAQIRSNSFLRFNPVLTGNGVLSEYLTGQKHLISPSVLSMAWLLGLWLGDGTTKEPEISVDSLDTGLMEGLIERCRMWGIYPSYKDEQVPLRAKHVKLYFGSEAGENRRTRHLRKNNPFWNTVLNLKFKREMDGEKQVPVFMWSEDLKVREAFLAGLIDSDGYVIKRKEGPDAYKVAVQTIYPSIMNAIVHISRSLGIAVTITTRSARSEMIEGRKVNCHFTYDCTIAGRTPLQNVLSNCRSGHKMRSRPQSVSRDPIYFGFTEEKRGQNTVYSLRTDSGKPILLDNKLAVHACGDHCIEEQAKFTTTKCLKYCIACPRKGVRYFYRDWSGKNRLCGRCYGRYKFSGYRCLSCSYVPEAREVRIAKRRGEELRVASDGTTIGGLICGRCNGILKFDEIRGPRKVIESLSTPLGLVPVVES
ncbi:hypothetical protein HG535_0G01140 [Zygotorulaspora mrakii]|uniref:DOD-type homing endonuclease domain-containing protein n=1 Tax=Zygotorulaspora mrakii TaxID=42260 RepID=A0A7H9B6S1_ZYGMR|nr:uncharacterized protein HG535_0G01140 [Zygotorulaspora mrakii]QLG74230.1 hypothetical protein HG535_0G01140 [Zygotorulaspora mrakii]